MPVPLFIIAQTDYLFKLLCHSLEYLTNVKLVTASGFIQKTTEVPSTIQVITENKITEIGYGQLEDALRDIPGIDMIHLKGYCKDW